MGMTLLMEKDKESLWLCLERNTIRTPMTHKEHSEHILRVEIDFEPKISRWFIFRFLWVPAIVIPLIVYAVVYGLLELVHFFYMLFFGKRHKDIFNRQLHFIHYAGGWQGYLKYFTNGHPPVLPWEMK